jgi:hypothetical protein
MYCEIRFKFRYLLSDQTAHHFQKKRRVQVSVIEDNVCSDKIPSNEVLEIHQYSNMWAISGNKAVLISMQLFRRQVNSCMSEHIFHLVYHLWLLLKVVVPLELVCINESQNKQVAPVYYVKSDHHSSSKIRPRYFAILSVKCIRIMLRVHWK